MQKCVTSFNLLLPPLEKLFVFCFLNRTPLTSPRLSLSCAYSHQPRVTLSATQGRQSEHDAKTGRKSRMASGSPKESEDLGMETIKGKPELVCNTHPAVLLQPPQLCRTAGTRPEGTEASWPDSRFLRAPAPPDNTAAWPGHVPLGRVSGGASQPLWGRAGWAGGLGRGWQVPVTVHWRVCRQPPGSTLGVKICSLQSVGRTRQSSQVPAARTCACPRALTHAGRGGAVPDHSQEALGKKTDSETQVSRGRNRPLR